MARAPWEPREGETEEERETRLAADDVRRRLEQARQRELEEAYWRSRATSSAPDADSSERNVVGARSATPRATLAGVCDAAPSTRARLFTRNNGGGGLISDLEVQELARAASRVGATPDVSRRVAEEVLAAERVAVDAALRRASAHRPRSSARASSTGGFLRASTPPRPRPVAFETHEETKEATKASSGGAEETAIATTPRRFRADDDDDDASAGMTSALWRMARSPGTAEGRDETRVSASFFAPRLGEENERVAAAAVLRARGGFGGGDPESRRRARAAFSQAAAAAVEDGLRRLVARANDNVSKRAPPRELRDGGVVFSNAEGASPRLRAPVGGKHAKPDAPSPRTARTARRAEAEAPRSPLSSAGNDTAYRGDVSSDENEDARRETAWLSSSAFARAGGDDDAEDETRRATDASASAAAPLWLEDDLRAVRAAHAAARRAEDAAARLEADERAARLATAAAVARLLDARVALAAATARAVSEEAATSTALCAAESASLRLTMDDEMGPSGDRGAGTCEALAEALRAPLPNVRVLSKRRPA